MGGMTKRKLAFLYIAVATFVTIFFVTIPIGGGALQSSCNADILCQCSVMVDNAMQGVAVPSLLVTDNPLVLLPVLFLLCGFDAVYVSVLSLDRKAFG